MPFINKDGVADVIIPTGQKITICVLDDSKAKIYTSTYPTNINANHQLLQMLSGGSVTLGPYASDKALRIEASSGQVEYAIGATPNLTNPPRYTAPLSDTSTTPGNATIQTQSGRAAFAAASASVTITNALVSATSKIFCQVETNDGTLKSISVVPGAGSFVVTGNAAATGITKFSFIIIN